MLLQFSTKNYGCFKDRSTLITEADHQHARGDYRVIFSHGNYACRVVGVFGDTATGKSQLLNALKHMRSAVLNGGNISTIHTPSFLSEDAEISTASFFEIVIFIKGIRYRYGFEVNAGLVKAEWLYTREAGYDKRIFTRTREGGNVDASFTEASALVESLSADTLLLSVGRKDPFPILAPVIDWFSDLQIINATETVSFLNDLVPQKLTSFPVISEQQLFAALDMESAVTDVQKIYQLHCLNGIPKKTGEDDSKREWADPRKNTALPKSIQNLLTVTPAILKAFNEGGTLFIDDLDAHLTYPLLKALIRLFYDPELNLCNPQLVFTTHLFEWLHYGQWLLGQRYLLDKPQAESKIKQWSITIKDIHY